jgi:hypothetical protein
MTLRRLGASPPHVVASSPSSLPAKRTLATGTQPVCPWELSPARFGGLMASSARPRWRVVAALPPVLNRPEALDSRAARTVLAAVSSRAMTRRADACAVGRSHKVPQRRQAIDPVQPPHPARAISGGDCCFGPGCERVPGPSTHACSGRQANVSSRVPETPASTRTSRAAAPVSAPLRELQERRLDSRDPLPVVRSEHVVDGEGGCRSGRRCWPASLKDLRDARSRPVRDVGDGVSVVGRIATPDVPVSRVPLRVALNV